MQPIEPINTEIVSVPIAASVGYSTLFFNPHFLDRALQCGLVVVECPVTFHPRWGASKGGNVNNLRALLVGLRMMVGITTDWRLIK